MNGVRTGWAAVVLGLGFLSVGMRELLADVPCGATATSPTPPVLTCGGGCSGAGTCNAVSGLIPGKPPVTYWVCRCSAGTTSGVRDPCRLFVFVNGNTVTPICLSTNCPGKCGTPTLDPTTQHLVCPCSK